MQKNVKLEQLRWIFKELNCLNKLALVGAANLLSDAIQLKTGTVLISRTSGDEISNKDSALFFGQTIICITSYVIVQGICTGMSALCSQAYGARNQKLVGTYFMRALVIASLSCFPLWSLWISVGPLINYITGDSELAEATGEYTSYFCFGYPAFVFCKLANGFLQSQNIVFTILCILIAGNVVNIFMQYVLTVEIPLGIKGVAIAYTISLNVASVITFCYIRFTTIHIDSFSGWSVQYLSGWLHFISYAISCAGQLLFDMLSARIVPIVVIGFIIGDRQQFALIGILNVVWYISSCLCIGYGNGATIRVGNLLGMKELKKAKNTIVLCVVFITGLECLFSIIIFSLSNPLSYLLTSVEEMRVKIEFGLKILSICVIFDVLTAIRGLYNACGLQHYATLIQMLICLGIACPLGVSFAFYIPWKAAGYYLILSVGYGISALCEVMILFCVNWDKIVKKVQRNTEMKNNTVSEVSNLSRNEKICLILRYGILFAIGICIFLFTCLSLWN